MTNEPKAVRRMWEGGPLRSWSPTKTTLATLAHARGGFVGSYACDLCRRSCDGVYSLKEEQKWLCGACKSKRRPSFQGHEAANPVHPVAVCSEQGGRR
jgi:hypothetical protein